MKESVLQFGDNKRLLGILSHPDQPTAGRPAIIIPNTGVEHRVGPNRLHVLLSRALAASGFAALRMDLSGMGDSLPAPPGQRNDSVADMRAALDELTRTGIADRFVVMGICSGGNDAHLLSCADTRIVGGVYIDHYSYPTLRFRLVYLKERLFDLRRWGNYLTRKIQRRALSEKEAFRPDLVQYFVKPTREQFASHLDQFMARHMALMFIYTGGMPAEYNYRGQLTDGFPKAAGYARLALDYLPATDHTFSRVYMRQELVEHVTAWLRRELC